MFNAPERSFYTPCWGKITKKMVDPITFSCPVNIAFLPRIEDCSFETTCLAQAHPRIPGNDHHNIKSRSTDQRISSPSAIIRTTSSATSPVPKPLQPSARDRSPLYSPSPPNNNARRTNTPVANTTKEKTLQAKNKTAESIWATPFGEDESTWTTPFGEDEKKQDTSIAPPERNVEKLDPNMVFASFEPSAFKDLDAVNNDSFSDFQDSVPPRRVKDATSDRNSKPGPKSLPPPNDGHKRKKKKKSGNSSNNNDPAGKIKNSLGAFFNMASQKTAISTVEADNQSLSSKSLTSRSVHDRSLAERSKAEQKLLDAAQKLHEGDEPHNGIPSTRCRKSRVVRLNDANRSLTMRSINELSFEGFSCSSEGKNNNSGSRNGGGDESLLSRSLNLLPSEEKDGGHDADARSISQRSTSNRSKKENQLAEIVKSPYREKQKLIIKEDSKEDLEDDDEDEDDDIKSITMGEVMGIVIEKKLWFKDGHEEFEIPYPTNSMYDDLFWTEEELGDFRYAAFLEEAGLDVDEYM
jgi:hypothetical protein